MIGKNNESSKLPDFIEQEIRDVVYDVLSGSESKYDIINLNRKDLDKIEKIKSYIKKNEGSVFAELGFLERKIDNSIKYFQKNNNSIYDFVKNFFRPAFKNERMKEFGNLLELSRRIKEIKKNQASGKEKVGAPVESSRVPKSDVGGAVNQVANDVEAAHENRPDESVKEYVETEASAEDLSQSLLQVDQSSPVPSESKLPFSVLEKIETVAALLGSDFKSTDRVNRDPVEEGSSSPVTVIQNFEDKALGVTVLNDESRSESLEVVKEPEVGNKDEEEAATLLQPNQTEQTVFDQARPLSETKSEGRSIKDQARAFEKLFSSVVKQEPFHEKESVHVIDTSEQRAPVGQFRPPPPPPRSQYISPPPIESVEKGELPSIDQEEQQKQGDVSSVETKENVASNISEREIPQEQPMRLMTDEWVLDQRGKMSGYLSVSLEEIKPLVDAKESQGSGIRDVFMDLQLLALSISWLTPQKLADTDDVQSLEREITSLKAKCEVYLGKTRFFSSKDSGQRQEAIKELIKNLNWVLVTLRMKPPLTPQKRVSPVVNDGEVNREEKNDPLGTDPPIEQAPHSPVEVDRSNWIKGADGKPIRPLEPPRRVLGVAFSNAIKERAMNLRREIVSPQKLSHPKESFLNQIKESAAKLRETGENSLRQNPKAKNSSETAADTLFNGVNPIFKPLIESRKDIEEDPEDPEWK